MSTLAELWTEGGFQQGLQLGLQQGLQQGLQWGEREGLLAGIKLGLELKFGNAGLLILPEVYKIENVYVLQAVQEGIRRMDDIESLRSIYTPHLDKLGGQSVN
ncbi:MAG: hypothetical protein U9R15_00360 [Chloroflexota bacterium]|nr:hypothetical protein [Chloroflexota bacterium]